MEERKLNFNAPFLSVRRYSTTAVASTDGENGKMTENNRRYTIPFYKTNLNLEQVTEPAAVPFVWEKIPGRPKDGGPEPQHSEESSVTPRLPLQRARDIVKYPLEKEFEDRPQIGSCSLNGNVARLDCLKEENDNKATSDIENDDDVYSDALDALFPNSFSINCSVSGLSGSDDQAVKRSGTFSTDPQTRDFMMSSFLPAAKATALEPPQYASRRQPVAIEQQSRQIVKVVREDREPIINESIDIPHYGEDAEEEIEDEVDECDNSDISGKACGLFPRLCLNKSFCLLNPVPALKVRTHSSISSSSDVRNLSRAAYTESRSQCVKKHTCDAVYKHQSDSGVSSPRPLQIENKMTNGSNQFACLSDHKMSSRSSPYRRGISPYRNEIPQSPFHGGAFLGVPKEAANMRANKLNLYNRRSSKSQEFLPYRSFNKGSGLLSPAVEKTLYVDTVNFAKRSFSNLSSLETTMESRRLEQTARVESSSIDAKCLSTVNGDNTSETKIYGSAEASQSSFTEILRSEGQADTLQCFRLDGELNQAWKSLVCINVTTDENLNIDREQKLEADPGSIDSGSEQSPLPPPLPKKPSESWLWHTRPSVSSRNSFSHSNLGTRFNPKRQDPKPPLTNTKWETIVKTSYGHHD